MCCLSAWNQNFSDLHGLSVDKLHMEARWEKGNGRARNGNQNTQNWTRPQTHMEKADSFTPSCYGGRGWNRGLGSPKGAKVQLCSWSRCPGNRCNTTYQNLRAVFYPDWHCPTVTSDAASNLVQKQRRCHVPMNKARSNQAARPREAQLCWSAPSQLSTTPTAVCKSAPHLLFHLNDLPSLAGLSLSRACIQGNKSYRGKNGSKKLLKSQYPF